MFTFAAQRKLAGIVLFSDGNPLAQPGQRPFLLLGQRDGFAETRQRLNALTADFHGKVLLVHGESLKSEINNGILWHRKLGSIGVASGWSKFTVDGSKPNLFLLVNESKAAVQRPAGTPAATALASQ